MKNKVLLVDDSITIHRVIDLSIDTDRYDTIKVFTEEDAIQELKESNFDFILLDNKLENTNIIEYTATIKSLQPGAKIILLVGAFDKFDPEDLPLSGADDYLVKPFDSQSLTTKLTLDSQKSVANQPKTPQAPSSPPVAFLSPQTKAAPSMDEAFIKNIAHADIERENTRNNVITPKPVNMDALFHDPSLNPGKVEAKGSQLPYEQRTNPFGEDEDTEEQQTFDPNAQFEGLYPNNKKDTKEMEILESEETFGIPSNLSEPQNPQVQNNTLETGFAKEKTFGYEESVSVNVPEKEFGSARSGSLATEKITDSATHLDYSNMSYQTVEDDQQREDTKPIHTPTHQPNIPTEAVKIASTLQPQQPASHETTSPVSNKQHQYTVSQEAVWSAPGHNNAGSQSSSQQSQMRNEQSQNTSIRETADVITAPENGNYMKETEETDFYQLDENDIFNTKPVTQIFEEEILSLDAPEKDSPAEKPISQKFEEEVLSIEEPLGTPFQPDTGTAPADDFFDPANLDSITEGQSISKNISQKFEEEILSIDTPEEHGLIAQDEDELKKNIRETFDNEIMALSAPEGNDNTFPNVVDYSIDAEEVNISDDFSDDPMTQDFANDIFPKDDIPNNSQVQNIQQEKYDEQVTSPNNQEIIENPPSFEPLQETEEPLDDFFATDIKVTDNKPSIMDESLDLDALLGMDLADLNVEQQVNPAPKTIVDAPEEDFTQVADSHNDLFANVSAPASETVIDEPLLIDTPQDNNSSKTNDNLLGNITDNTQKIENSFFSDDTISSAPKVDTGFISKIVDDNNFGLIQMDATPSTSNKNNDDNILSGITVTISKNEIMKMLGSAIDKHFLEKAVQDVLAQNMREIVRAIVPAIAEKFIKEEIEKLKDNNNNNDGDI